MVKYGEHEYDKDGKLKKLSSSIPEEVPKEETNTKEQPTSLPEKEPPLATPPATTKETTIGCLFCIGVVLFVFVACTTMFQPKVLTEAEKKEEAVKVLDEWFSKTSHFSCEVNLENKLKDPDSYVKSSDFIITKSTNNSKTIIWKFRAKNGFGGYNVSYAGCDITKENGGTTRAYIVE